MLASAWRVSALLLFVVGCGAQPPEPPLSKKQPVTSTSRAPTGGSSAAKATVAQKPPARREGAHADSERSDGPSPPPTQREERPLRNQSTLADLAEAATAAEFALPNLDEGKIAAA